MKLPRTFFAQSSEVVARELLGTRLVSCIDGKIVSGQIVEVEAYLPDDDSACHATRGRTKSNNSMFEAAGTAYVYPIHSRFCFNISTQKEDEGTAVLIRAVQPLSGIDVMMQRRQTEKPIDLCRGPARLCESFSINRQQDGVDLTCSSQLWLCDKLEPVRPDDVIVTERIGVTSAKDMQLRFALANCRYVSGPKRLRVRK